MAAVEAVVVAVEAVVVSQHFGNGGPPLAAGTRPSRPAGAVVVMQLVRLPATGSSGRMNEIAERRRDESTR